MSVSIKAAREDSKIEKMKSDGYVELVREMNEQPYMEIDRHLSIGYKRGLEIGQKVADEQTAVVRNRLEIAKKALREIADPIEVMQETAQVEGNRLNGLMAIQLAHDPHYLRKIASDALKELQEAKDD